MKRQAHRPFDEIKFYGIFGLIVVAVMFYIIIWGII